MPWHVVHCPFSRKIFSPAATSCAGVTLPPSSDSSSGGLDSIWGIELANQLKLPMTARANDAHLDRRPARASTRLGLRSLPPAMGAGAGWPPWAFRRRVALLAEPAEPEDEHDHHEEQRWS